MARIPEISNKMDLPPEQQHVFDQLVASRGTVVGPFKVLLNSPEIAARIGHTGAYIRFESSLPPAVNELVVLIVARELDCQFEWTAHEPIARSTGVSDAAIVAIRDRNAPDGLSVDEAMVATYAQELLRNHRISSHTFKAALEKFGPQTLTDLTATIGYYSLLACVLNAFEVQPEAAPLLPL